MRKIIQITSAADQENYFSHAGAVIVALCDDGTLWETNNLLGGWPSESVPGWKQLGPIPETNEPQLLVDAKYVINHHQPWDKNHGCNECVPDGPLTHLQPGFICTYHRALKLIRPPEPSSELQGEEPPILF